MSLLALGWAVAQKTGSVTRKAVLMVLCNYADDKGHAWPSVARICQDAELSERAAQEALRGLEATGFLIKEQRKTEDGGMRSNLYKLRLEGRGSLGEPRVRVARRGPDIAQGVPDEEHETPLHSAPGVPYVAHPEPSLRTTTRTKEAPLSLTTFEKEAEASLPAQKPDPRKDLFDRGVREIVRRTGRAEGGVRGMVGKWLKHADDNAVIVLSAVDAAFDHDAADPVPWIERRLSFKRNGAGPGPHKPQPRHLVV